ncbi:MAG: heme o synthase [Phycisphaeraceae bacterium]
MPHQDDSAASSPPAGGAAVVDRPGLLAALAARISDHITMTKPGITVMVGVTAGIGFVVGAGGAFEWVSFAAALVGTAMSCMGAGVFNQVIERDTDALMRRTADRPLPAGRVSVGEAMLAGVVLAVAGVGLLWVAGNLLAAALAALTIVTYAMVYTPLKRMHSVSTVIGAVPGAMPPVIGYAAAAQWIGVEAVLLFAIMFWWQIPHFLAIGWLYRDEYARAGLPILPVIDPTGAQTFRQILVTSGLLLVAGLLPTLFGFAGWIAFAVALAAGGWFLVLAVRLVRQPTRQRARGLFLASLVYLPVVLAAVVVG